LAFIFLLILCFNIRPTTIIQYYNTFLSCLDCFFYSPKEFQRKEAKLQWLRTLSNRQGEGIWGRDDVKDSSMGSGAIVPRVYP